MIDDFPQIYLDNMASTPLDPRVGAAMAPFWSEAFGNPHSNDHQFGWTAHAAVEHAALRVAALIQADPDEIVFTSGATEANNLALLGLAHRASPRRRRILLSAVEHKSVIDAANGAARRYGMQTESISVGSDGLLDIHDLRSKLSDDVLCVAVMAVNNEIGTFQEIAEISAACAAYGAVFICDAVQAPLARDIDVTADRIDMLSLSAHKMYGPKGIGALYIRRDVQNCIEPMIYGGGQQRGLRSGTLSTPLCVGFGEAASIAASKDRIRERERIGKLRDMFEEKLHLIDPAISINGRAASRHPGNANIRFGYRDARHILSTVQPKLAASTGSACTSGTIEPSHVLRAIGLSEDEAKASIRFSLGRYTNETDIDAAVAMLGEAIAIDEAA